MTTLKNVKLFLLDMDGTFYLGNKLLPGADEFLAICKSRGVSFSFLTNNSSKSKQAYLGKLAALGVTVGEKEMFTSGDATLLYLKQMAFDKNILLIGTESLAEQFRQEGYILSAAAANAVVLGFDTTLTYDKLTDLCNAVSAGLPYIATHPDVNCPVDGGYIPDIGATIAFVQEATGRLPDVVVGKPNKIIVQSACQRFGVSKEDICMVGDRLYTDIALGQHGVKTALLLCGETKREDIAGSTFQPDFVFDNLLQMCKDLE